MDTGRIMQLMDKEIKLTFTEFYKNRVEIFKTKLINVLNELFEKEMDEFKEKMRLELYEKQDELIAQYLIKIEELQGPLGTKVEFIVRERN